MAAKGNKSIWKFDWRQTSVDDCKFKLLGLNNFVRGFGWAYRDLYPGGYKQNKRSVLK